jgi:hypothetical protein
MNMEQTGQWQYKTIFFEFHKDGLLGDKYIDDEQVENILNEEGSVGWELITVSMVPEGMIAFCKRPLTGAPANGRPTATVQESAGQQAKVQPGSTTAASMLKPEKPAEGMHRPVSTTSGQDTIGDIKIS